MSNQRNQRTISRARLTGPPELGFLTSTSHLLPTSSLQEGKWLVSHPTQFLNFLRDLGPEKTPHLRTLRIFPSGCYFTNDCDNPFHNPADTSSSGPEWRKLLTTIAAVATGLDYVYVFLDAEEEDFHYGAGLDVGFVKALGEIKLVPGGTMELTGMFARGWPEYLEKKVGMKVWDEGNISACVKERLRRYQLCKKGRI